MKSTEISHSTFTFLKRPLYYISTYEVVPDNTILMVNKSRNKGVK